MNIDHSETITKGEYIRRLKERAEKAEKERDDATKTANYLKERRKSQDDVIYALGKENRELAAQVVAYDILIEEVIDILTPYTGSGRVGPTEEVWDFLDRREDPHPAAARLMERLRLLEEEHCAFPTVSFVKGGMAYFNEEAYMRWSDAHEAAWDAVEAAKEGE